MPGNQTDVQASLVYKLTTNIYLELGQVNPIEARKVIEGIVDVNGELLRCRSTGHEASIIVETAARSVSSVASVVSVIEWSLKKSFLKEKENVSS